MAHDIFGRDTYSADYADSIREQEARDEYIAFVADEEQALPRRVSNSRRLLGLRQPLLPSMEDMYDDAPYDEDLPY
jgi:hypothetical protein